MLGKQKRRANRRFWQANRQSEHEYRHARTDEEAHAALYNQIRLHTTCKGNEQRAGWS